MNRRIPSTNTRKSAPIKKRANVRRRDKRDTSLLAKEERIDLGAGRQSTPALSEKSSSSLLRSWLWHHQRSALSSLNKLFEDFWQSLMTWSVIAIAIVLPVMLFLALSNVQQLGQDWRYNTALSVYLKYQASPPAIENFQARLERRVDIERITLVSPEEAKLLFQSESGLGRVLDSLDVNPLPTVLVIQPVVTTSSTGKQAQAEVFAQLEILQQFLLAETLVESIQFDTEWLQRLYEMMTLAQRAIMILGLLLAFGVLLVVVNTLRLTIESRRSEIVVVKLVGGTDGFVRRPFLYAGLWYGLGGGVLATVFLIIAGIWIEEPVANLAALYEADYALSWVNGRVITLILMVSAMLGWVGAAIAVARHLKKIEPV